MPRKKKSAGSAESAAPAVSPKTPAALAVSASRMKIARTFAVRAFLAGMILAGGLASLLIATWMIQDSLTDSDRYRVDCSVIDCPVPPGSSPAEFLAEVREFGRLPNQLSLVDPRLPEQLRQAFAFHPWVESVDGVRVTPRRRIEVALTLRTPILAVHCEGESAARIVDRQGVLLPASATGPGLPELVNRVLPPTVTPGQPWPDPVIQRAVELAREHKPLRIEKTRTDWRLTRENQPVLRLSW